MDIASLAAGLVTGILITTVAARWRAKAAQEVLTRTERDLAVAQEQVRAKDAEFQRLAITAGRQEADAVELRRQADTLGRDLAGAQARLEELVVLRRQAQDIEARATTQQRLLAEAQARTAAAESTAAAAAARQAELLQAVADLRGQLDQATQQLAQLAADRATAAADLDAVRTALATERTAAGARLGELAAELQRRDAELIALRAQVAEAVQAQTRLTSDLANERKLAAERAAEVEKGKALLKDEFSLLANRLLEEKGKALAAEQKTSLEAVLTPLRERIKGFEETVTKTYDAENRDRASLLDLLKRLGDSQTKLGKEAENLSRALSGESKAQGDWGEMILENLLQSVGLEAGREYQVQESHTSDEGGRLRPDVVIYLPDNKAVVVDSKVSISAFIDYTRADVDEARMQALNAHGASVRSHIKDLAGKRYQDVLQARSLDFVILFVPSEAAFHAAIGPNPALYNEAYGKGIILASPTTLLATLKVVAHVWQTEKQNTNAQKIAEEAGKLLDKFVGFAKDLQQIGDRIAQAQEAFQGAKGKLETGRGNLIGKARMLVKLGAKRGKAEKELDLLTAGADEGEDDAG